MIDWMGDGRKRGDFHRELDFWSSLKKTYTNHNAVNIEILYKTPYHRALNNQENHNYYRPKKMNKFAEKNCSK